METTPIIITLAKGRDEKKLQQPSGQEKLYNRGLHSKRVPRARPAPSQRFNREATKGLLVTGPPVFPGKTIPPTKKVGQNRVQLPQAL